MPLGVRIDQLGWAMDDVGLTDAYPFVIPVARKVIEARHLVAHSVAWQTDEGLSSTAGTVAALVRMARPARPCRRHHVLPGRWPALDPRRRSSGWVTVGREIHDDAALGVIDEEQVRIRAMAAHRRREHARLRRLGRNAHHQPLEPSRYSPVGSGIL